MHFDSVDMFKDLHSENLRLEEEIEELTQRLSAIRNSPRHIQVDISSVNDEDSQPETDVRILKEKCKLMQAQIANLTEDSLITLPENEDVQFLILKDDMLKRTAQYRECCSFLSVQRKEIMEDIQREEKTNGELKAVISAAEMKLQETINEKHSKSEVFKRLESKCTALDKCNSKVWKDMSSFLDEYYPLPDQDAFTKVKKKLSVGGNEDMQLMILQDLKPLKDIVKELMTACIDTPNEPYIVIDHRYWPPYVDLLLQVDIALRHPDDSRQIKLMPFHL